MVNPIDLNEFTNEIFQLYNVPDVGDTKILFKESIETILTGEFREDGQYRFYTDADEPTCFAVGNKTGISLQIFQLEGRKAISCVVLLMGDGTLRWDVSITVEPRITLLD